MIEPQAATGPDGQLQINAPASGPPVRFQLLGPIRALRDGAPLDLGPAKQAAVLAALLVNADRSVSRDELIRAVWNASDAPPTADNVIATYVLRLRRILEPARAKRAPAQLIQSTPAGYRIFLAPGQLDVYAFHEAVADARKAHDDGNSQAALDAYDRALALWRGTPLEGVPGPLARTIRRQLGSVRVDTLEERLDTALGLGRHQEVIAELTSLAVAYPARERVRAMLMLALYRSGRQAEALAVFQDARRTLVEDLGIEPGRELQRLQEWMLRSDPRLDAAQPHVVETSLVPAPAQLPADLRDFTGREEEVERVRAALEPSQPVTDGLPDDPEQIGDSPGSRIGRASPPARIGTGACSGPALLTISGAGGMGKTALAVHAAHLLRPNFPDGQLFVDLHGMRDQPRCALDVLRQFIQDLGAEVSSALDDSRYAALYRTLLDGRRMLIVLDDARDAAQVRALLPGGEGCAVLITSRSRLSDLDGNQTLDLGPFAVAESHALLERIVGEQPVRDDERSAVSIVTACSGLPLALRIVAARAAGRPAGMLGRLADRLGDERRRLHELRVGDLAVEASFQVGYDTLSHGADGGELVRAFHLLSALHLPELADTADLGAAENTAVALGAAAVSNSWGGAESFDQIGADATYFDHPGVAITASSGDGGYGVIWPAASPYVTAVGGTSLTKDATSARGWSETAWAGAGSGCSALEAKPAWQTDTGCPNRSVADVSAVADPNTGVAVYDCFYTYTSWFAVGGTSVASPIIASVYALAGTPRLGTQPASYPYANPTALNDVTSGSNGFGGICDPAYECTAGPGYDGPTGLGTPDGVSAFAAPVGHLAGQGRLLT